MSGLDQWLGRGNVTIEAAVIVLYRIQLENAVIRTGYIYIITMSTKSVCYVSTVSTYI